MNFLRINKNIYTNIMIILVILILVFFFKNEIIEVILKLVQELKINYRNF